MSYKIFYPTDNTIIDSAMFSSGIHSVYISKKNREVRKIYDFKLKLKGKNYDIRVDSEARLKVKDIKLKKIEWMKSSDLYDAIYNSRKIVVELLDPNPQWGEVVSMSTSNKLCDRLYARVIATDLQVPIEGKLSYLIQSTEISHLNPENINDGDDHCDVLSRLQPVKRFNSLPIVKQLY